MEHETGRHVLEHYRQHDHYDVLGVDEHLHQHSHDESELLRAPKVVEQLEPDQQKVEREQSF